MLSWTHSALDVIEHKILNGVHVVAVEENGVDNPHRIKTVIHYYRRLAHARNLWKQKFDTHGYNHSRIFPI